MSTACIIGVVVVCIPFLSCKSHPDDIPSYVQQLENVKQFNSDDIPKIALGVTRENIFGTDILIGEISEFHIDNMGNVFLADKNSLLIHFYDSEGSYFTSFGGYGNGPGEFRDITKMESLSNQLFIYDAAQLRVNIFNIDSKQPTGIHFLKTIYLSEINWGNIHGETSSFYPTDFALLSDGSFILGASEPLTPDSFKSGRKIYYYYFDQNGKPIPDKFFTQHSTAYLNIEPTVFLFPFLRTSLFRISDTDQFFSVWTEDFLVKKYDANGYYSDSYYYPIEKVSLSRSKVIHDYEEIDEDPYIKQERRRVLGNVDLPETWPALNNLLIDDENRLWISTIVENFDIYEWWVLEETGELITRFEWPRDEPIEVVKNDYMYTRETDEESGLQQIVRYRIEMEES